MPDAAGNFKGQGWSAKKADAWERIFREPKSEWTCPNERCFCTGACRLRDKTPRTCHDSPSRST